MTCKPNQTLYSYACDVSFFFGEVMMNFIGEKKKRRENKECGIGGCYQTDKKGKI